MIWVVTLEEDEKTGDLILPLSEEILQGTGWVEGDTLEWTDNKDGSWTLSKKEQHSHYYYDTERNK